MGVHVIKMPDIGEGIAEVELVAWHVQPGDAVTEDQSLADVMTDKATVEIPSPVAGTVLALGGKLGEVMAVGSELIRIEVEGAGNVRNRREQPRRRRARPQRRRRLSLRQDERNRRQQARRERGRQHHRRRPCPPPTRRGPSRATSPSPPLQCAAAPGIWVSNCSSCPAAARQAALRMRTSTHTPGRKWPWATPRAVRHGRAERRRALRRAA